MPLQRNQKNRNGCPIFSQPLDVDKPGSTEGLIEVDLFSGVIKGDSPGSYNRIGYLNSRGVPSQSSLESERFNQEYCNTSWNNTITSGSRRKLSSGDITMASVEDQETVLVYGPATLED